MLRILKKAKSPTRAPNRAALVDYSQYGQSLILEQLITEDTPPIVVDIGAHDGINGSNSRLLLEQGWRGLLVEPVPSVFSRLRANSAEFRDVSLVEAACSDHAGMAFLYLGKDGAASQMSSLSRHPEILHNVTNTSIEVRTTTLADLVSDHAIPADFGVLLVDTEGWDLAVLRGLDRMRARPRIIVTEEFGATNEEKYAFLAERNYQFVGAWGYDSFWVSGSHPADTTSLQFPIRRLPASWLPQQPPGSSGRVMLDDYSMPGVCVIGWAWTQIDKQPEPNVALTLSSVDSPQRYLFQAWRIPRPNVAAAFGSEELLMSGYRAHVDVPSGVYDVRVIQLGDRTYTNDFAGRLRIAVRAERLEARESV
jgi:FkbM family methyltransferase